METKTEVGTILQHLNYKDNEVQRFDDFALHLYCIPMNERYELLASLMWYCNVAHDNGQVRENYIKLFDKYSKMMKDINKQYDI